jgi:hypothetical protein
MTAAYAIDGNTLHSCAAKVLDSLHRIAEFQHADQMERDQNQRWTTDEQNWSGQRSYLRPGKACPRQAQFPDGPATSGASEGRRRCRQESPQMRRQESLRPEMDSRAERGPQMLQGARSPC